MPVIYDNWKSHILAITFEYPNIFDGFSVNINCKANSVNGSGWGVYQTASPVWSGAYKPHIFPFCFELSV